MSKSHTPYVMLNGDLTCHNVDKEGDDDNQYLHNE